MNIDELPSPENVGGLLRLVKEGEVSGSAGKKILSIMAAVKREGVEAPPETIADVCDLRQISCPAQIGSMVDDVLRDNPDQARQYREGNKRVLGFLVGKVMKLSNGRANPRMTNSILSAELNAEAA